MLDLNGVLRKEKSFSAMVAAKAKREMQMEVEKVSVVHVVHPHGNTLDKPPGRYLVARPNTLVDAMKLAQKMNDDRVIPNHNHYEVESF